MDKKMKIGIVIPSYNEEKNISRCLEHINYSINYLNSFSDITRADTYDINIILVDSSKDNTKVIAKDFEYTHIISSEKLGIAFARQLGTICAIRDFNSEIIISTDADIIVPYNWLFKIYNHFKKDKDLVALAGIYRDSSGGFYESVSTAFINRKFIGLGGNTTFRSTAFSQTEGYDTRLSQSEDIDLWKKLKKIGNVVLDKDLYVYHDAGYRWRAGVAYSLSTILSLVGMYKPLEPIKYIGYGVGGYELIKNGERLKEIPYNNNNS